MGGLARRASIIEKERKQHPDLLLLDAGDMFDPGRDVPELRARTIFKAMEEMQYDAVNIADGDVSLGISFLDQLTEKSNIGRLSASLVNIESGIVRYPPYLVKNVGEVRVGIIGITDPFFFQGKSIEAQGVRADDAIVQLDRFLPELRQQADIVVLLSHMRRGGTLKLLSENHFQGIDIAIVGQNEDILFDPIVENGTIVLQNGVRGEYLGKLILNLGNDRKIASFKGELILLTKDIQDAPWAAELTASFEKEELDLSEKARKAKEEEKRKEMMEALAKKQQELLKMTPEEAIKHLPVTTQKLF